jgi:SAM-dependent methyltransferase
MPDFQARLLQAMKPVATGVKRPLFVAAGMLERFGRPASEPIRVEDTRTGGRTRIDEYWTGYMVNPNAFLSAWQSSAYLDWRMRLYPELAWMMDLWGDHEGETVLDYGCGPGDDTTGFLIHSKARRVIGMDVSPTALQLAAHRLRLHRIEPERVRLILTDEGTPEIPLEDASVGFVNSGGVLHHTTDPAGVLREIARVLAPGGTGRIMVYNTDSVWANLMVAWWDMLVLERFEGLPLAQAVQKTVDGEDCPVARFYKPEEFIGLCNAAGLDADFVGGYFCPGELHDLAARRRRALADERLPAESRDFLERMEIDERGRAVYEGQLAGWGGVYRIGKA